MGFERAAPTSPSPGQSVTHYEIPLAAIAIQPVFFVGGGWVLGRGDQGGLGGESYGFACCDGPIGPSRLRPMSPETPLVTPPS